eukprot:CAMPEP_0170551102 /NCGR_PEP_ID=MMETSP0211-20121228/9124_1 /TAXON_ID=311385 /ORGANISM="Pseudokeronopsis sp., Strain OXSARD2" /LENGTH=77 /DNA_ID=CAMNT_0010858055 /DNA_START=1488 /DNA_END=1721 /DNA_ORIENTATION=+
MNAKLPITIYPSALKKDGNSTEIEVLQMQMNVMKREFDNLKQHLSKQLRDQEKMIRLKADSSALNDLEKLMMDQLNE